MFSPTRAPTLGVTEAGDATGGALRPISTSNCCRIPAAFSLREVRSRSIEAVSMPPVATSTAAFDSAGICIFTSFAWGLADVAPQVAAACGPEFTLENMQKIGERVWNMEREFNNKAGFTAKDDNLPPRLLNEAAKTGPAKGLTSKLPEMLPKYYAVRGWNADGTLKPETRERLGL